MNKYYALYFFFLSFFFFVGCSSKTNSINDQTAFADSPLSQVSLSSVQYRQHEKIFFAVELNGNGMVFLNAKGKVNPKGNYEGRITSQDWFELSSLAEIISWKDTIYPEVVSDDTYFDVRIKFKDGRSFYQHGFFSSVSDSVKRVCQKVLQIRNKVRFSEVGESHKFEVNAYQFDLEKRSSSQFIEPKVK